MHRVGCESRAKVLGDPELRQEYMLLSGNA